MDKNQALQEWILDHLCSFGWSPEQIPGFLQKNKHSRQNQLPAVSHETIYAWIYSRPREKLWRHLARRKAKITPKLTPKFTPKLWPGKIPHFRRKPHSRAHLHSRPPHASGLWPFRGRFDELPQGKPASNEISTGVLHERKTRFVQAVRLPNKTAKATAEAGMGLLKKLPRQARKSLTLDNGGAFAKHTLWRKHLRMKTYFCDPYASWQKGGTRKLEPLVTTRAAQKHRSSRTNPGGVR